MTALIVAAVVLGLGTVLWRMARRALAIGLVGLLIVATGLGEWLGRLGANSGGPADSRRARVVDGDTFSVRTGGDRVSVRVALIDAGESSAARFGRPTCGGAEATRFAERWAGRRPAVRLRGVPGLPAEDRYDRRLARVADAAGRDYGLAAVRRGWARVTVYEAPHGAGAAYLARLRAAEGAARAHRRGAWRLCDWARRDGVG